jgi:hypothetical protein
MAALCLVDDLLKAQVHPAELLRTLDAHCRDCAEFALACTAEAGQ